MCEHGNTVDVNVMIPAELSHTGQARWAVKPIDQCLSDIVRALNLGITEPVTAGACCGHGQGPGEILLCDGRVLVVRVETGRNEASNVVDTR